MKDKTTKISKEDRKSMLDQLAIHFPDQKFGRRSSADLLDMVMALEVEGHDEDENEKPSMGEILAKYRVGYVVSITPQGRKSRSNGDELAQTLETYEPAQIIPAAEILLEIETGVLVEKYTGMNQGQARMNVGNRLRAAVRRGDITIEQIEKALNRV